MRNISFMMTQAQFRDGSKDVTRRVGWLHAKPLDKLMGCEKCQGLGPGGKIVKMGIIQLVDVRRERLDRMLAEPDYGVEECRREGFPEMTPLEFLHFYVEGHKGTDFTSVITRLEFRHIGPPDAAR